MKPAVIGKTVYKVSDFLSWQRSKSLILSPSFQRRSVWNKAAKSYLIDTVVRGLPIPIIFIRERPNLDTLEADREVVDGQQRLRTLLSFLDPACLKDYREEQDAFLVQKPHNPEIAGKTFASLPTNIKQQILGYEFSVHILPADTDDTQVLQIFARLNSTGMRLKAQELRNARFLGPFKALMYGLAYEQLERWRKWTISRKAKSLAWTKLKWQANWLSLSCRGFAERARRSLTLSTIGTTRHSLKGQKLAADSGRRWTRLTTWSGRTCTRSPSRASHSFTRCSPSSMTECTVLELA